MCQSKTHTASSETTKSVDHRESSSTLLHCLPTFRPGRQAAALMQGVCGGHHVLRQLLRQPHACLIHKRMGPADLRAQDHGSQAGPAIAVEPSSACATVPAWSKACNLLAGMTSIIQQRLQSLRQPWAMRASSTTLLIDAGSGGDDGDDKGNAGVRPAMLKAMKGMTMSLAR